MKLKTQVLFIVFVVAAGVCLLFTFGHAANSFADSDQPPASITAIPIQTARDGYGLAMIDHRNQTVWIYEINSRAPADNKLRLVAARSFKYDRMLDEFNTAKPGPEDVKKVVEATLRPGSGQVSPVKALLNEPNAPNEPNILSIVE
jgi:hypothetical protein